jgi:hypothetical protein
MSSHINVINTAAESFSKLINGTEQIIEMTYSYNANGSINNIDMTGAIPTTADVVVFIFFISASNLSVLFLEG